MPEPEDGGQTRNKTAKERREQNDAFTNQNNQRQHPLLEAMTDCLSHILLSATDHTDYTVSLLRKQTLIWTVFPFPRFRHTME